MGTQVKKHKFNVIDAILIILILAAAGAALYYFVFSAKDAESTGTVTVRYEVEFRAVRNELRDVLEKGFTENDDVYEAASEIYLGKVISMKSEPAMFIGNDMSDDGGNLVISEYPDHSNITMVIEATAEINYLNRYKLAEKYDVSVGSAIAVRLPYFTCTGYCVGIEEVVSEVAE